MNRMITTLLLISLCYISLHGLKSASEEVQIDACITKYSLCIKNCQQENEKNDWDDCYSFCQKDYTKCSCVDGICGLNPLYDGTNNIENCSTCPTDCKCPDGWTCDPGHQDAVIGAPGSAWNFLTGCVRMAGGEGSNWNDTSQDSLMTWLMTIIAGILGIFIFGYFIRKAFRVPNSSTPKTSEGSSSISTDQNDELWEDVKFCSQCGKPVQISQNFCKNCGAQIDYSQ